jgi:thiol-disulfide isomerase/thioredoxin
MKAKTIVLIVVLAAIVGAIVYLQKLSPAVPQGNGPLKPSQNTEGLSDELAAKAQKYPLAPNFIPGGEWLNSPPLNIEDLRGKVVLVDFWTYSCINCIRTLPYITMWDEKYRDQGLVIVGVHTPEFEFEKDPDNVRQALAKYDIKYPVVQDNDYQTWSAYANHYWPHKYLVDIDGFVRYDHIGEGGYEQTELMIQGLLEEKAEREGNQVNMTGIVRPDTSSVEYNKILSPELYLGAARRRHSGGNAEGYPLGETITYTLSDTRDINVPYNTGTWLNEEDDMQLMGDSGSIFLKYNAKSVNIVAGADPGSMVDVYVDGVLESSGSDAMNGMVSVKGQRLYNVVNKDYAPHDLELRVHGHGFRIYTFTFG